MHSIYFWGILVLKLMIYETDGIQGGKNIDLDEESFNQRWPFLGRMVIPEMHEKMHHCTVILITKSTSVTAGHCILYSTYEPFNLMNFTDIHAFVVKGEWSFYNLRRITNGYLHKEYDRWGSGGIKAKNDLGLLKHYDFPLVDGLEYVKGVKFSDEEIDAATSEVLDEVNEQHKCELASWGATTVFPKSIKDACSSPGCSEEIESVCLFDMNHNATSMYVRILSDQTCHGLWRYGNSNFNHIDFGSGLQKLGVGCHKPAETRANSQELQKSTTKGDEGAPIICYTSKHPLGILIGMHVGGLLQQDEFGELFAYPSYYIPYKDVKQFLATKVEWVVQWESKGVPYPAPDLFITIVSLLSTFS